MPSPPLGLVFVYTTRTETDAYGVTRQFHTCPWCREERTPFESTTTIFYHECKHFHGWRVWFLNGWALSGAGLYNIAEASQKKDPPSMLNP
jgi:hypothetical protein